MNVLNTSTTGSIDNATIGAEAPNPLSAAIGIALGKTRPTVLFATRDSHAALIVSSGRILVAMNGNPNFPAPIPVLSDITATRNAFIAAVNTDKGGPQVAVTRRQLRAQLAVQLRSLALYVQQTSGGDRLMLISSGYPLQKARQPVGLLPAPDNLRLARGKATGQLKARCNAVPQASSCQWRYATAAAPTVWTLADPTAAASIVLTALAPGTVYVVQVRAVGTQGPSDWSDSATLMVV
jgi:hypothetical protein